MALNSASVQRNLGAKMKVAGLEAPDLLLVLIIAAVMNLIFGETSLVLPMGFGIPLLMFFGLLIGKQGKPEKFLLHLLQFFVQPGFYSAGEISSKENQMRRRIYDKSSK